MAKYQIAALGDPLSHHSMSAFGYKKRRFQEAITATTDATIESGIRLPDLIRRYFSGAQSRAIGGKFGFLTRDDKTRAYTSDTDAFVMTGQTEKDLGAFASDAKAILSVIVNEWKTLGLPTKFDHDRQVTTIDEGSVHQHPVYKQPSAAGQNFRDAVQFLAANADIMLKACVVRAISPGWWAVSYAGKNAADLSFFRDSLEAHITVYQQFARSPQGRAAIQQEWIDSSDPIDTNPGYPYFSARLSTTGAPLTRDATVSLFKNLCNQGYSWSQLLEEVDARVKDENLAGHPFAVAPLRRLQPGYKWMHQFEVTGAGLVTGHDLRGLNSQRVAWMVPYAYNLCIAPASAILKAFRRVLPGAFHGGPEKKLRHDRLRRLHADNKLFLVEGDYSNFDRFLPIDLLQHFIMGISTEWKNNSYWRDALMHLHRGASLIWPDYYTGDAEGGWIFKPGPLALLSGVKVTADTGTITNSIINAAALARTYDWDRGRLITYLGQYLDGTTPGSKTEYYYIQSDDTALIASSNDNLTRHRETFVRAVAAAGLKGSVSVGDRFLMRHIQSGADRPVPTRVWQNTMSNEEPVANPLIFLAGLAARTDGLFGLKSVDAFGTGNHQSISAAEARVTHAVLRTLRRRLAEALRSVSVAVQFIDELLEGMPPIPPSTAPDATVMGKRSQIARLSRLRDNINKEVARTTMTDASVAEWVKALWRDRHAPSSQQLLDDLAVDIPGVKELLSDMVSKEKAYFERASVTLGVRSPLDVIL